MGQHSDDAIEYFQSFFKSQRKSQRDRRMAKNMDNYVFVECEYKTKTDNAVLIVQSNEEVWIPRSLLAYKSDRLVESLNKGDPVTFEVREWFCRKNELEYN